MRLSCASKSVVAVSRAGGEAIVAVVSNQLVFKIRIAGRGAIREQRPKTNTQADIGYLTKMIAAASFMVQTGMHLQLEGPVIADDFGEPQCRSAQQNISACPTYS